MGDAAEENADRRSVGDKQWRITLGDNGPCLSSVYESLSRRHTGKHIPPATPARALYRGASSCSIIVCQHSIQPAKAEPMVKERANI